MRTHLMNFVSFFIVSCGSSQPQPAPAQNLPPLPRSSIAAVLLHRDELVLTDDQVHGLQQIDEELADRVAELSDHARTPRDGGVARRPYAGAPGGGRGMGSRRGMGRPRASGGSGENPNRPKTLQDHLDDLDTQAYLQAEEEILTDAQRERARDIAEAYREALYDRRHRQSP
jgi:hypothetical protein